MNKESFFFKSITVKLGTEFSSFTNSSVDMIDLFLNLSFPMELLIREIAGVVFIELVINICSIAFILSLNCVMQLVNILTSFFRSASSDSLILQIQNHPNANHFF